jgi:hypothetical protein
MERLSEICQCNVRMEEPRYGLWVSSAELPHPGVQLGVAGAVVYVP